MVHKCIQCGKIYEDNDPRLLKGCECGSVFFMYFKSREDLNRIEEMERKLKEKKTSLKEEIIKKMDIATVKKTGEGIYEINIYALLNKKPLIIFEKGKAYSIHLPSVFEKVRVRH